MLYKYLNTVGLLLTFNHMTLDALYVKAQESDCDTQ